jgi:RluA family pseudouridine synthase
VVSILFENHDIVAVNKPEGLAAIPERRPQGPSVLELLSARREEKLFIVHRLDKETSGVMIFARNAQAHRCLSEQFEARTARKVYQAVTHGVFVEDQGEVDVPLRQFGSGRVAVDAKCGKASVTEYAVIERFASHTLVEVRPRTGRRHQIRVHLYHIGHPIVGDGLYGDKTIQARYRRLMLHSHKLTLSLPSGTELTVQAPMPRSLRSVLNAIPRQ